MKSEIQKLNEALATVQEKYNEELQDKETDENETILENQDQDEDFEAEGI